MESDEIFQTPRWHSQDEVNEILEKHSAAILRAIEHMDAQGRRIAELEEALKQCRSVLAMFIHPDTIMETTVLSAYTLATAAEAKARSLIPEKVEG